ncbi:putative sodium-dependent multivitamin transporter [Dermacentor variabilis]|uniref:putative sodium-dependent multivitamin transporter n=1 Tax=Dermacentor variabilis TaxID=34621 RepID=UPI003F5AF785
MPLHPVDYAAFSIFTSLSLALGLYYSTCKKKARTRCNDRTRPTSAHSSLQHEEVFLGGRSIPSWQLAISVLASVATGVGVVSHSAHQYAYGFHFAWHIAAMALTTPCIVYFFLPVLYQLKVTSVFEYLRMRFGNLMGISASLIYFFFSQILGAVSIYSAAVGMSTMLDIPLFVCDVAIGLLGTSYTALGGLRGVVWADCVQGIVLFAAPFVIIGKILYDSAHLDIPLKPLSNLDTEQGFLRLEVHVSSDETVWACAVASVPFHLVREGMDQMVAQRFLAARSIRSARRVVWAGTSMLAFFILSTTLTGLALTYWYRDCDPMLTGDITRYDQMVPFYVGESLANVAGLGGLFLSGLVGASISTVSSVVNSHAATFYVDIVSPNVDLGRTQAVWATHFLEFGSGALMTALAVVVPHVGTATRILMSLYSGASGPFAGMVVAAICLPWTSTKGTAVATSLVFLLEIWQTIGRTLSGLEPPRTNTTLERCAHKVTTALSGLRFANESEPQATVNDFIAQRGPSAGSETDVFLLYRVSSYWSSFIALLATVSLSLVFSLIIGENAVTGLPYLRSSVENRSETLV